MALSGCFRLLRDILMIKIYFWKATKMQVAANYLLSLINDVLQMSKIEDGNVPLTKDIIDFSKLTKDIIDIIEQRAKERGIKMQFNAKNDIRYPFVYGSPVHLRQIF